MSKPKGTFHQFAKKRFNVISLQLVCKPRGDLMLLILCPFYERYT